MSKKIRSITSSILAAVLVAMVSTVTFAQARKPAPKPAPQAAKPLSIYDQGYQKGYGDGYTQGQSDYQQGAPRDYESSDAFRQREQRYDQRHASNIEYLEAFDLGFEFGYLDGYYGRARNAAAPANGAVIAKATALASSQRPRQTMEPPRRDNPPPQQQQQQQPPQQQRPAPQRGRVSLDIPANTLLNIRLNSTIDTKNNRSGDRFTAMVIGSDYDGATIEGHIAKIDKSGRVTGRTELALAFDTITLPDGRQAEISASLEKVVESETVKKVDEEGNVQSGSRSTESQKRGGIGAAAGAIIGGIIGGGKGAVLGAVLGGAAGVGTVYVEGDKDLILDPGTEMIIRVERGRVR